MRNYDSRKRILVTGGAGFLGSHLCDRLLAQGHEVLCADNLFTGTKRNIDHLHDNPRFELVRHDVTFPLYVEVDEIYNLACPASPIHYQHDPVQTTKTSVHGAINMLGLAKRLKCRIFQASTSEVYGDPQVHPQPESYWGNVNPVGIRSCYDEGKRCAETLFFDYYRQHGLEIKVARIFNTYGPRMHPADGRVVSNFIVQALKNEPITLYGDGQQTRSFCYVDDLMDGFVAFMSAPAELTGPLNLGNPSEFRIVDLAERVIAATGSRSKIVKKPLPEDDPAQRQPDIALARRHLSWEPKVELDAGLARTIGYFEAMLGRAGPHADSVNRPVAPTMCGIAGIYAYRDPAPPVDGEELLRIREHMARRGPDGAGMWLSEDRRIGLAHRRLAIIDLSEAGAQPMASADGRYRITFNGEIYNYRELRRDLESKGFLFRTESDTEVLLHLYADRGQRMVDALRGMFAFGIWDAAKRALFLARDPFGIKPLYYADDGKTFRFATLVGALLEGGGVDTGEDVAGIAGFYLFGCVPEPFTFHRAIRALPAGSTLHVGATGLREPTPYFSITEEFRKAEAAPRSLSPAALDEEIRSICGDSMRYHMVSDVPVGIFLSAGVDSSVLAALGAQQNRDKLHAITLGFREYRGTRDDETVLAEKHAEELGIRQTTRWIERGDFRDQWRSFFAGMDQASTDGVNSYLVSNAAAASGLKVAISGLGGDELFGGYPSFRDIPRMRRLLPHAPRAGKVLRQSSAPLLGRVTSPKYAGLLEYGSSYAGAYLLRRALYMPWELPRLMGRERAAAALETLRPLARLDETIAGLHNERCIVSALEFTWYMRNQLLRDADWAGMAHGVEIRVPFVDVTLLRAFAPMLAGSNPPTKARLVAAIGPPLSADIATRRKTGFSVPVREWLRAEVPHVSRERGLRGWARVAARLKGGRRFLSFVTDAYGGHGGIALYNRDLLQALCSFPGCARVVAFPRTMPNVPEPMPEKLVYLDSAAGGKLRYLATAFRVLRGDRSHDLVVCGHINLLPLAWLASRFLEVPLVLFIYGIDAWKPTRSRLANLLASRIQWVVSISEITARKFHTWVPSKTQHLRVLPNAIHPEWYGPGARSQALLARYGLQGKTILMTLGRLVSVERYKGFDEALDVLPELAAQLPDVAYMVVGDGSDRARLEEKARALGVADRVVFTGNVPEAEKADHYRLADVYVMPSQGEGFGFVLLEAMACGIPVIASKVDGGREAVRDGRLGMLVEPGDKDELKRAIFAALKEPRGVVPTGLEHFSFHNFEARAHALFGQVLAEFAAAFRARMKTALILGVSGQDGAYLAHSLLDKGYAVFGGSRDAQMQSFANLARLGIRDRVTVESVSLNDFRSVIQTLDKVRPDEVYNLSGQSSVALSFEQPVETLESIAFGTLNLLEAIRFDGRPTRLYNAGSSECFGDLAAGRADETTPFRPRSPYAVAKSAAFWEVANYREAYDLYACSGILFNHESSLRPERFVTRKVIAAACRIAAGSKETLHLGDLGIARDWGWAPEYVDAMWRMLQQDEPGDYVVATGETHSLQEFVEAAFSRLGLEWRRHVVTDATLARPNELKMSQANPAKAHARLDWKAKHGMRDVVRLMIEDERTARTQ